MSATRKMSPWLIKRIIAKGGQWRGFLFGVKYQYNRSGDGIRLAVVISKKVLARAHERNFVRRRTKSAFANVKASRGLDMVIFPKAQVAEAKFDQIEAEVRQCLSALR